MDVRKALLFSNQLQANKKRCGGGGAGVCDNVQLLKCLCFKERFSLLNSMFPEVEERYF